MSTFKSTSASESDPLINANLSYEQQHRIPIVTHTALNNQPAFAQAPSYPRIPLYKTSVFSIQSICFTFAWFTLYAFLYTIAIAHITLALAFPSTDCAPPLSLFTFAHGAFALSWLIVIPITDMIQASLTRDYEDPCFRVQWIVRSLCALALFITAIIGSVWVFNMSISGPIIGSGMTAVAPINGDVTCPLVLYDFVWYYLVAFWSALGSIVFTFIVALLCFCIAMCRGT